MSFVQVRRHSLTKKGTERGRGSHLSREGVDLARRVGAGLPRFDLVVASDVPRTAETAIAFGCSVDDEVAYPDPTIDTGIDFHAWWQWDEPFVQIARIIDENGTAEAVASTIADTWAGLARQLPEEGRALAVSHGGVMEVGLLGCLEDVDRSAWGRPFSHCEGFELLFYRDRFMDVTFMRVSWELAMRAIPELGTVAHDGKRHLRAV